MKISAVFAFSVNTADFTIFNLKVYARIIPFLEKTYQEKDIITFSVKPNLTIKEFEHLLSKQSKILEAGCGEGQNAIYLAQQGYCNTDAFDLSENG